MKKIILLLLLSFGVKTAFAECAIRTMNFFPETKEISLNSKFIIQGYGLSQETIIGFKTRKVFLESEHGELIELHLQEFYIGQMALTQAVFCPVTELKPNTKYVLKYADQTKSEEQEMYQYNRAKQIQEKVYWKTTAEKHLDPLNSDLTLDFEETEVVLYGCGPSANAVFAIKNKPKAEIWYKTEVVDLSTNTKTVFYIKEWDDKLQVGHGMCAGAFTYKNKGNYKVRFTPMNIDGKSLKTTEWTTFESPYMSEINPFGN